MKTYAFLAKTYAKKGMSDAKDAMKTLSAKTKKHVKKHKMKYSEIIRRIKQELLVAMLHLK